MVVWHIYTLHDDCRESLVTIWRHTKLLQCYWLLKVVANYTSVKKRILKVVTWNSYNYYIMGISIKMKKWWCFPKHMILLSKILSKFLCMCVAKTLYSSNFIFHVSLQALHISAILDTEPEMDEHFVCTLFNPTGGARLGMRVQTLITVLQNQAPLGLFSISAVANRYRLFIKKLSFWI